jgi:polyphosphate glucokinase
MKKKILVVDIGGSNVKVMISRQQRRKFKSGPKLTPRAMIEEINHEVEDWKFDAVSIGFPAPVRDGRILDEPKHLGKGWVRFNFEKAFRRPVRIINDAAIQALGSYRGGRMLFLGLGTGLGSTLVLRDIVLPLELGDLPYRDDRIIEDFLGKPGVAELGDKEWERQTMLAIAQLRKAFIADYVVLGGGNAKKLRVLPEGAELGHNRNAYLGGVRLWHTDSQARRPKWKVI